MLLGTLLSLFPLAFSTKDGLCSTLSLFFIHQSYGDHGIKIQGSKS
jgi:hypothetical protein